MYCARPDLASTISAVALSEVVIFLAVIVTGLATDHCRGYFFDDFGFVAAFSLVLTALALASATVVALTSAT